MKITGFDDTIEWYNSNSDTYAQKLSQVSPDENVDDFVAYLPANSLVLEVGCGPGRETALFSKRGIKTVGIDISSGLLEVARKANPATTYIEGNFLHLSFPNEHFDGVWSHASLVHLEQLEDAATALSEFHRVLKPNGVLYLFVKERVGEAATEVVTDSLSNHERFFRYYSIEELSVLVKQARFDILGVKQKADAHGRTEVTWIQIIASKTT